MGERIKKLKKIRIHREGTHELTWSALAIIAIAYLLWYSFSSTIPFWIFIIVFGAAWLMALNFYRCPIRYYNGDTEKLVVAPADGKIVVVEEAEENEYFHDKRLMISIFMSPLNVHANWFPIDGKVKFVGQYSPFAIDNDNINEILFIGSGNKIGYSKNPRQLKSCRAHFWVQPNGFSAGARVINLDFGDGMTTSINLVEADGEDASANGIYSLDGRRVKGEPTQKGVYITKGKKIVK